MKKNSLFQYDNEILFIKNYLQNQENKGHGLLKKWSEKLGIHTTLMSQIMSEKRNLSEEIAFDLADLLYFTSLEKEYFLCLVKIRNSGNMKLKKFYQEQKNELKNKSLKLSERIEHKNVLSDAEKNIYYSNWLYQAVRMFCSLNDEGVTTEKIIESFGLPSKKILPILEFLKEAQMIVQKNQKWKSGQVISHLAKDSVFLPRYHANWRLFSINNATNLSESELMYTSAMTISEKDFLEFREKIVLLIKELGTTIKETNSEKMAIFTIDFLNVQQK